MIKVGYLNVEGLTFAKHQACVTLIDVGLFDVLFLAETWFTRSFPYMQHPYSFLQTKYIPPTKVVGRAHKGILMMTSPHARSHVSSWKVLDNALVAVVDSYTIIATYLPPSLSPSDIQANLAAFPPHDLLLGDINVRFHGISTSNNLSPKPLQEIWRDYMRQSSTTMLQVSDSPLSITPKSIQLLRSTQAQFLLDKVDGWPTVGHSLDLFPSLELDHTFSSRPSAMHLRLLRSKQFGFRTAHEYLIHLEIQTDRLPLSAAALRYATTSRYYLENLSKPEILALFRSQCTTLGLDLEKMWPEDVGVDDMDQTLVLALQSLCEIVLGSYSVDVKKKSSDRMAATLSERVTSIAAIRLFKRKQRAESSNATICPRSPNGDVVNECRDKFAGSFSDPHVTPLSRYAPTADCRPPPEWERLVEPDKISKFLRSYPADKACGADNLHILILRALRGTPFIDLLSRLFLRCLHSSTVPKRWNSSIVHLLPKKDPPITADSVRPLSVLPMFRRIFESLLIPGFTDVKSPWARLHPCQAGFRKGYSTLSNIAIAHHGLSTKLSPVAIFLDYRAAYDMTKPEKVMRALEKHGMPPFLLRLVYSTMFTNGQFSLIVNGITLPPISRNQGLPQGSPLSPIIFNLFIDSLLYEMDDHPSRTAIPSCLFYADDGVILAQNIQRARKLLAVAADWSRRNEMVFNISKCGVILPSDLRPFLDQDPLLLQGEALPVVESYKYLGLPITADGIDFPTYIKSRAETAVAFLKYIQFGSTSWTPSTRWAIYRTFLRPQVEYAAPLVYAFTLIPGHGDDLQPLQTAQSDALAWILNTKVILDNLNHGLLGVLPVTHRFRHLRCQFELHKNGLHIQNPFLTILAQWRVGFGDHRKLLYYLRKDDLYEEFRPTVGLPRGTLTGDLRPIKAKLHDFLISKRMIYLRSHKSVLLGYITDRTESLVDKSIYAPVKWQSHFLSWRRGALFLNRKCVCNQRWNRSHIKCLPSGLQKLSPNLIVDFEKSRSDFSTNYSIIDFLLNKSHWKECWDILNEWSTLLVNAMTA
jgi:Reverse transcriptase (RNA-dependent DNA polymerase)